jgi:adenylate cyclase
MEIQETKLVLLAVDLAGYTKACANQSALTVALFLDGWYRQCVDAVRSRGGRVVKFIGDACLATFPESGGGDAIAAARALATSLRGSGASWPVELSANVHVAVVAAGDFGPDDDRRYDVLGSGVNHLFRMGGGSGIRISEPVYRQIPDAERGPWRKNHPPATYTLS